MPASTTEIILNEACIPAMAEVGPVLLQIGEKFVPEMLIATRAMSAATTILKPLLAEAGVEQVGTVVIGTVAGDLHDIGKNLVGDHAGRGGLQGHRPGHRCSATGFCRTPYSCIVPTLSPCPRCLRPPQSIINTIAALQEANVRDQVKVMVGGAPITQAFADKVGADGFSADAGSAARRARALLDHAS